MSIWVGRQTRLLVQGLTGREGTFHALASREYGTQVVAGVTPGKGGTTHEGIPVFGRQGRIFFSSFHPELANDLRLHELFIREVA